eukprot:scaffold303800_cov36-Tisochrysis_lutea.AAC.2
MRASRLSAGVISPSVMSCIVVRGPAPRGACIGDLEGAGVFGQRLGRSSSSHALDWYGRCLRQRDRCCVGHAKVAKRRVTHLILKANAARAEAIGAGWRLTVGKGLGSCECVSHRGRPVECPPVERGGEGLVQRGAAHACLCTSLPLSPPSLSPPLGRFGSPLPPPERNVSSLPSRRGGAGGHTRGGGRGRGRRRGRRALTVNCGVNSESKKLPTTSCLGTNILCQWCTAHCCHVVALAPCP